MFVFLLYEPQAASQGNIAKRGQQKSKWVGRADIVEILLMTEFYQLQLPFLSYQERWDRYENVKVCNF